MVAARVESPETAREYAMRPITSFTLHAMLAAVLTAFAATSAAAQFLALGDSIPGATAGKDSREKWIEIQSWQWGTTSAAKFGAVGGMHRDSDMSMKGSKIGQNARESGEKGGTEDINIGVGELQEANPAGVVSPRDAASGQATGKRQHKPMTITKEMDAASPALVQKRQHGWVTVSKPLDRGRVRVKVKFPWASCAVGNRYPAITLGDRANSYQLRDVTVASCGSAADGPEESITFVYGKLGTKVQVRGWDPEKKEQ
jgi:type VI protein secretion system component Hcp